MSPRQAPEQTANRRSLAVPDLLQGDWRVALFLTFGAELDFFQRRIANQLTRTPTRLVLADDQQLGAHLAEAAAAGRRLSQANRTYTVAPVRNPGAAHAKAILLGSTDRGLLLTGSGNMSTDGYAGNGELWHVYSYQPDQPAHRSEFGAVRSLVDGIAAAGWTDPFAVDVLAHIWQQCPWIPLSGVGSHLSHTLDGPLADRIIAAIEPPVSELTVHAPFYDRDAAALAHLIKALKPTRLRVLLSHDTSADPEALARVVPGAEFLHVTVRETPTTYLHAKWIHALTDSGEVLISGSANLSRAALILDAGQGNIELVRIEHRPTGGFADLYEPLELKPVAAPSALNIHYLEPQDAETDASVRLLWAQVTGSDVRLHFDSPVEAVAVSVKAADGTSLTIAGRQAHDQDVRLRIADASVSDLIKPGNLHVVLDVEGSQLDLAVWPYRIDELQSRMAHTVADRILTKVAALPDTDADLRDLLERLEGTLLFDNVTAWRAAPAVKPDRADEEATLDNLKLEDIDWSQLPLHPRHAAYRYSRAGGIAPTDIQLILSAISAQVAGLGTTSDGNVPAGEVIADPDDDLGTVSDQLLPEGADARDTDDSEDDDDLTGLAHHLSVTTRTRMAFHRFLKRYGTAIADPGFQEALGPVISVQNAAIFNHLMYELLRRDVVSPDLSLPVQVALWRHLWGAPDGTGLLADLDQESREACLEVLEESGAKVTLLRVLAAAWPLAMEETTSELVRDACQDFIGDAGWGFGPELVRFATSGPEERASVLAALRSWVTWTTPKQSLSRLLAALQVADPNAAIGPQLVHRGRLGLATVPVLTITATVPDLSVDQAVEVLRRYRFESERLGDSSDYWRIRFSGNGSDVVFWDGAQSDGVVRIGGEQRDLSSDDVRVVTPVWLSAVDEALAALEPTSAVA